MNKDLNLWDSILIFALIIVFVISIFVVHIDNRVDKLGAKIDYVEKKANQIAVTYGD